jgi:predicted O-methyltransferase YrrM
MSIFSQVRVAPPWARQLPLRRQAMDFCDLTLKRLERQADYLIVRRPAYPASDWLAACAQLERLLPGCSRALDEPGLQSIATEMADRRAEIQRLGPWGIGLNADDALARCLYVATRALQPTFVVETGVGYGVSTAHILQALAVNGHGRLDSVDLPLPGRDAERFTAALVPARLRERWTLHRGTSRRKLPALLAGRTIDLFVHDSSHTYLNMRCEFARAWPRLRTGGVLIADDVECSQAFEELRERAPRLWCIVWQEGKRALFGIAVK